MNDQQQNTQHRPVFYEGERVILASGRSLPEDGQTFTVIAARYGDWNTDPTRLPLVCWGYRLNTEDGHLRWWPTGGLRKTHQLSQYSFDGLMQKLHQQSQQPDRQQNQQQ